MGGTIFAAIFGYEKINLSIVISLILGMIGIFFLSTEINIFEIEDKSFDRLSEGLILELWINLFSLEEAEAYSDC